MLSFDQFQTSKIESSMNRQDFHQAFIQYSFGDNPAKKSVYVKLRQNLVSSKNSFTKDIKRRHSPMKFHPELALKSPPTLPTKSPPRCLVRCCLVDQNATFGPSLQGRIWREKMFKKGKDGVDCFSVRRAALVAVDTVGPKSYIHHKIGFIFFF